MSAWIREWYQWDFEAAGRSYRRAIELDPGYALAHTYNGVLRLRSGRYPPPQQR